MQTMTLRYYRNPYLLIVIAELMLAMVACYAIFCISWDHIMTDRGAVVSSSLAEFDSEPIATTYVKKSVRATKEQIVEEMDETMWTTQELNYREGPGKRYDVAGTFNAYASVDCTGETFNKWTRIEVDDNEYYVASRYLTDEEPIYFDDGQKGEYQRFAYSQFEKYGWGREEMNPLIYLWNRESGWNPSAHNGGSGAHGIPQSLPASKMAAFGSDYYTNGNTQIKWGLNYIANRYGSPSNAWSHWCSSGWY